MWRPDVRHQWEYFPSCRLFVGAELDVALCRHADPVMNRSALHYLCSSACFPQRVPPLHHSIAQATNNTAACAAARRSLLLNMMKIPTIPGLLWDFFCCVAIPCFAYCVWLIELQLQLNYGSLHTLILWDFKAACVSFNPKSLWNDAKKYRCGISCRLLWQIWFPDSSACSRYFTRLRKTRRALCCGDFSSLVFSSVLVMKLIDMFTWQDTLSCTISTHATRADASCCQLFFYYYYDWSILGFFFTLN